MALWRKRSRAREIQTRLEDLKSDFLALQKDMRSLAEGVGDAASDVVHTTNRAAENALDWTNDNIDTLQNSVRRQPLMAVVLSMGAGALVGVLLSRR